MKIAIINDKILRKDLWQNSSDEQMIVNGYSIVDVPEYVNTKVLTVQQFDYDGLCYCFNEDKYKALVTQIIQSRYVEQVEELIRQKYSVSDEIAILRQKESVPNRFEEYNLFCEQCKSQAKLNTLKNPYQYETLYIGLIKN